MRQITGMDEIVEGLRETPRRLPCRLLWDARGAQLFARICELEDYYPTRHELAVMREHLPEIASAIGPMARVIEPGSGLALKTRLLLDALVAPAAYVPIEVEAEQLAVTTAVLRAAYPDLDVEPVCGDYMQPFDLPRPRRPYGRTVVFFPGSTIGNFELADAETFLAQFARLAGDRAMLVLGADSNSDADTLVRAYDDRDGVTAQFDRNVLEHVNRKYDATFQPEAFDHRAVWDPERTRVEMRLVSRRRQSVRIGRHSITLEADEPIVTEHCYKYPVPVLEGVLERAGWRVRVVFADPRGWMRLWLCERA